jgi:hypothetical protein
MAVLKLFESASESELNYFVTDTESVPLGIDPF